MIGDAAARVGSSVMASANSVLIDLPSSADVVDERILGLLDLDKHQVAKQGVTSRSWRRWAAARRGRHRTRGIHLRWRSHISLIEGEDPSTGGGIDAESLVADAARA